MQSGTLTLIISLLVMGGVIAYFADLLGRILGKKRLTLGRMRPKHTAALFTTSAGAIIPIVTLGLLSIASQDVRVMLTESERVRAELSQSEGELRKKQAEISIQSKKLEDQTKDLLELQSSRTQLTNERNQITKALARTKKDLSMTTSQARVLRLKATMLLKNVNSLRNEVGNRTSEVRELTKEYEAIKQSGMKASEQLREMTALQTRLDLAVRSLEASNEKLEGQKQRLESELKTAQEQYENADEEFRKQIDQAAKQLEQIKEEQEKTRQEIAQLQSLSQGLFNSAGAARTKPMVYSRGAELARITLTDNASTAEAENALNALLRNARLAAERKGAKPDAGNDIVALFGPAGRNGEPTSGTAAHDAIVKLMTAKNEQIVVLLECVLNSFADEPVPAQAIILPNSVVYRQGEVIAETRIDGSLPESLILENLNTFLSTTVSAKAIKDKMIPVNGSDAPLGTIEDEDVISIVREIRQYGRPVRVQALADIEVRRADRLKIRFRLR